MFFWWCADLKFFARSFAFWLGVLLIWELSLHLTAYEGLARMVPGLCFTVIYAAVLSVLLGLPGRAGKLCGWVLPPLLMLIYGVQLIYYDIFGSFLSLAYVAAGGDAVTTFSSVIFASIWRRLPQVLLLVVPVAGYHVLMRFGRMPGGRISFTLLAGVSVCAVLLFSYTVLLLPVFGPGSNQPEALFRNPSASIDRWVEHFGVLTAEALDLGRQGTSAVPAFQPAPPEEAERAAQPDCEDRNLLPDMDFDALLRKTDDPELKKLCAYLGTLPGTRKNEYTGLFAGYNLIVVCAEAFSPSVIDEALTPTLYRMSHEGIVFENFYNSFPNLTTNGEYSLCTGLMPDLSRMSFAVSVENYLPYALGNICTENGMKSTAYHNNIGTFYNRVNTHPNMGYTFKAVGFGLDMEAGSPSSDLEMMEKSVDDYLTQEPFHTYYMTYSGHSDYGFDVNEMSARNRELVESLEHSEQVRAYLAAQLELEKAMTYLLERLEAAGIADHTVVVLTGDHMPYGLSADAYAELAGQTATQEPYWQYRNSFICWTGGLDAPIVVRDECCTMDILPTLLNLMGFSYDSRLLTGQDVLSDGTHMALLKDGSFLTRDMIYNADTGEITWRSAEDPALAQRLIRYSENQFAVSAALLHTNFYEFAFRSLELSEGRAEREVYNSYADTDGAWYKDAVELLTAHGALSGNKAGDFNGESPASNAEFVAMLARCLGLDGSCGDLPFRDVPKNAWYVDALSAALEAGLIPKTAYFRPAEPIRLGDVNLILMRANGGEWMRSVVADVLRKQEETGYTGAKGTISRGAAAYAVAMLIDPDALQPLTFETAQEPETPGTE